MTTAPFDIREFLLVAGAVLLGLTLHEAAHAYVAFRLGDDTGFKSGRLTFNPIKHVHPLWTVLLPLALIAIQAPFVIGWAKPVPIRASKLANPNRDMAFVAAAGPPANFVMAAVFGVIAFALQKHGTPTNNWLVQAVRICAVTNMLLGILNLIPVPPLDGSKVLAAVLPETWRKSYLRMGRHGYLLALMLIGLLVLVVVMIAVIRAIL